MYRFIFLVLFSTIMIANNGYAELSGNPDNRSNNGVSSLDVSFFDGYYASFVDRSANEPPFFANEPPFFVNETTGEKLYIGKDISLKNLIGYRFEIIHIIDAHTRHTLQSVDIDEKTSIDELSYPEGGLVLQLCVFAPDNTTIGKHCTDSFFGHTHSPETKKPDNYYYNFDGDFYITWVREKADSLQLPFFRNPGTNTNWYLGKDLPVSALKGYRLRVRPINGHGDIAQSGLDVKIDNNTKIDDLMFRLADYGGYHNAVRSCLYNPEDKPVGNNISCTDAYYGHNHYPYASEPEDYSYYGKMNIINGHSSLRGEFIDNYGDHKGNIPDKGEVTFALRFYRNDNIPISLNLSDSYGIDFFRKKATIVDTDSGESHEYQFQQTNSNITLALTVSHGLPANYKMLKIVEDKSGEYDTSNYFQISEVTTPDDEVASILDSPFYRVENKSNDSFEFIKLNSNIYVEDNYSHHISKRFSVRRVVAEYFNILISPESVSDPTKLKPLYEQHDSKLEKKLKPSQSRNAYDDVGYVLEQSFSKPGGNSVAFLTGVRFCHSTFGDALEQIRMRRSPPNCRAWVTELTALYIALRLGFTDLNRVVDSIISSGTIPAELYPVDGVPHEPDTIEQQQRLISLVVDAGSSDAARALQEAAAINGQAAAAYPQEFQQTASGAARSEPEVQQAVAQGSTGIYSLSSRDNFTPLPNIVRRVNQNRQSTPVEGAYQTRIFHITADNIETYADEFKKLVISLKQWETAMQEMSDGDSSENVEAALGVIHSLIIAMEDIRDGYYEDDQIAGLVYSPDGELIGIAYAQLPPRSSSFYYVSGYSLVRPQDLQNTPGAYRGAVAFLRSEMLRLAFDDVGISGATADAVSPYSAKSFYRLGFRHDEL